LNVHRVFIARIKHITKHAILIKPILRPITKIAIWIIVSKERVPDSDTSNNLRKEAIDNIPNSIIIITHNHIKIIFSILVIICQLSLFIFIFIFNFIGGKSPSEREGMRAERYL